MRNFLCTSVTLVYPIQVQKLGSYKSWEATKVCAICEAGSFFLFAMAEEKKPSAPKTPERTFAICRECKTIDGATSISLENMLIGVSIQKEKACIAIASKEQWEDGSSEFKPVIALYVPTKVLLGACIAAQINE